jgi:hypothetical protein
MAVHGVKIVRKIFIDFEPSMDLTGGKYHAAGAAGGGAREIRPRIVRLSVVPAALCEKKSSIDPQVALRRHFCHEPLFGNFLSEPALYGSTGFLACTGGPTTALTPPPRELAAPRHHAAASRRNMAASAGVVSHA